MSEYLGGARPSRPQLQPRRSRPAPRAVHPMDLQEVLWALQRCGGSASDGRLRDELASNGLCGARTYRRLISAAVSARLISSGGNHHSLR